MSKTRPLFTVVMPAYGVEKYLAKAVESIESQTFQEWELIIVEDGSPDKTGSLAEKLKEKDARIRVIHHEQNKGLSEARNTGIQHAAGRYIWFMDPDDTVEIVHILGRGEIKAYGDKPLHVMRMETKTVRTPGVKDGFFCLVPDQEHEGYYRPYLFVILDGTKTLEEVAELLKDTLEEHEYPVEIREITERPYFHFKTDRKGLTAQILKELEQTKEEK